MGKHKMAMIVRADLKPTRAQMAAWGITLMDDLSSDAKNDWHGHSLPDVQIYEVPDLDVLLLIAGEGIANNDHVHVLREHGWVMPGDFTKDTPSMEDAVPLAVMIGPSGGYGPVLSSLSPMD